MELLVLGLEAVDLAVGVVQFLGLFVELDPEDLDLLALLFESVRVLLLPFDLTQL